MNKIRTSTMRQINKFNMKVAKMKNKNKVLMTLSMNLFMTKTNNSNNKQKIQSISPNKINNNLKCEILREEIETLHFFKDKIKISKAH